MAAFLDPKGQGRSVPKAGLAAGRSHCRAPAPAAGQEPGAGCAFPGELRSLRAALRPRPAPEEERRVPSGAAWWERRVPSGAVWWEKRVPSGAGWCEKRVPSGPVRPHRVRPGRARISNGSGLGGPEQARRSPASPRLPCCAVGRGRPAGGREAGRGEAGAARALLALGRGAVLGRREGAGGWPGWLLRREWRMP